MYTNIDNANLQPSSELSRIMGNAFPIIRDNSIALLINLQLTPLLIPQNSDTIIFIFVDQLPATLPNAIATALQNGSAIKPFNAVIGNRNGYLLNDCSIGYSYSCWRMGNAFPIFDDSTVSSSIIQCFFIAEVSTNEHNKPILFLAMRDSNQLVPRKTVVSGNQLESPIKCCYGHSPASTQPPFILNSSVQHHKDLLAFVAYFGDPIDEFGENAFRDQLTDLIESLFCPGTKKGRNLPVPRHQHANQAFGKKHYGQSELNEYHPKGKMGNAFPIFTVVSFRTCDLHYNNGYRYSSIAYNLEIPLLVLPNQVECALITSLTVSRELTFLTTRSSIKRDDLYTRNNTLVWGIDRVGNAFPTLSIPHPSAQWLALRGNMIQTAYGADLDRLSKALMRAITSTLQSTAKNQHTTANNAELWLTGTQTDWVMGNAFPIKFHSPLFSKLHVLTFICSSSNNRNGTESRVNSLTLSTAQTVKLITVISPTSSSIALSNFDLLSISQCKAFMSDSRPNALFSQDMLVTPTDLLTINLCQQNRVGNAFPTHTIDRAFFFALQTNKKVGHPLLISSRLFYLTKLVTINPSQTNGKDYLKTTYGETGTHNRAIEMSAKQSQCSNNLTDRVSHQIPQLEYSYCKNTGMSEQCDPNLSTNWIMGNAFPMIQFHRWATRQLYDPNPPPRRTYHSNETPLYAGFRRFWALKNRGPPKRSRQFDLNKARLLAGLCRFWLLKNWRNLCP